VSSDLGMPASALVPAAPGPEATCALSPTDAGWMNLGHHLRILARPMTGDVAEAFMRALCPSVSGDIRKP